jgi:hypothetical protein
MKMKASKLNSMSELAINKKLRLIILLSLAI